MPLKNKLMAEYSFKKMPVFSVEMNYANQKQPHRRHLPAGGYVFERSENRKPQNHFSSVSLLRNFANCG